MINFIYY